MDTSYYRKEEATQMEVQHDNEQNNKNYAKL